eukprot:Plantae.Rhodophyta-Palmaria_palmata.ctg8953.p1 GENE.Plantae.Rhodophyta-Palmaria_palmata.ctg8953~~Plantae.Rhodophyta-Palmaria_palmata.ctg8953.p1  ORF type:complete len:205 (+),score=16.27 Plantae.Rhodophyta-Palmaria_palmata.ctg8953:157-771(+)
MAYSSKYLWYFALCAAFALASCLFTKESAKTSERVLEDRSLQFPSDDGSSINGISVHVGAAAVGAGASVAAAAAALAALGLDLGSFTGSSNGDRTKFVKNVINHVNSLGYNVVVVYPPSLGIGYERKYTLTLRSRGKNLKYVVYVARRHIKMQVTNAGDGGWINWGLKGRNWVRWGNTVKFHPRWNKGMGKPYEVRSASRLPRF